jgi:hypothetical protein
MIAFKNATWRQNAARPCGLALTWCAAFGRRSLGHFHVARARQMIGMRAQVSLGRVSALLVEVERRLVVFLGIAK